MKYKFAIKELIYSLSCIREDIAIAQEKLTASKRRRLNEEVILFWKTEIETLEQNEKDIDEAINQLTGDKP